jgi:hypothetical protein
MLKPYISELAANVTAFGVPTMRPLALEFPDDDNAHGINDQCVGCGVGGRTCVLCCCQVSFVLLQGVLCMRLY